MKFLVVCILAAVVFFNHMTRTSEEELSPSLPMKRKTSLLKPPEEKIQKNQMAAAKLVPSQNQTPKDIKKKQQEEGAHERKEADDENWLRDTAYEQVGGGEVFFLSEEEIKEDFPTGVPKEINITFGSRNFRFIHPNKKGAGKGEDKTLYVADEQTIDDYVERLKRETEGFSESKGSERTSTYGSGPARNGRGEPDRKVFNAHFQPGKSDETGSSFIQNPGDVYRRVSRVDFNLSEGTGDTGITEIDPLNPDPKATEALKNLSRSLLSLGHGGKLSIEVADNGVVLNHFGNDFVVYENPFKIKDEEYRRRYKGGYFYELAYVEVSYEGQTTWFPCNTKNPYSHGSYCAGTVPTLKGGNTYNLDWIGKEAATQINVIDTGFNILPAQISREDAAGADIDAIRLNHVSK